MTDTFQTIYNAMSADPDLAARVIAAAPGEERAAVLRDAGLPVPNADDNAAGMLALADVSGGNTTGDINDASYGGEAAAVGAG